MHWSRKRTIDGNEIKGAIVQNRTNRFAIQAGVVIDASGDGDVAFRSGASVRSMNHMVLEWLLE